MIRTKRQALVEWTAIGCLLAVVAGIPALQAIHEYRAEGRIHLLDLFRAAPTKESLHGWDRDAREASIFARPIRTRILQWQYEGFGDIGPKAVAGRDGWLFYRNDIEYLTRPPVEDQRFYLGSFDTTVAGVRENLRNPLFAILDVRRQLAARGIRLVVVPVPGKPTIYPEMLAGRDIPPEASPTLRFIDTLRAHGIDAIDLVHPLRSAKAGSPHDLFLHTDTHWSPAGVDVAAGIVAAHLSRDPAIAARRDPARYVSRDTLVERYGDIVEMSALPRRKEIWRTESVTAHRVFQADGKPYADSDSAAILWLGDSYTRIYQENTPNSAGIVAQVAKRLGQPLSSIAKDGGSSTVVRRLLKRQPELLVHAKVVVWEFVERDIRFGDKGWALEALP